MANFTSVASGNWNAGATWGNAGSVQGVDYPGPGDTATINHAVTVTADQTVGNSTTNGATITGTCSTTGNNVTGTGSAYLTDLKLGDWVTILATNGMVTSLTTNTAFGVMANFDTNSPGGSSVLRYSSSIAVMSTATAQLILAANIVLTVRGNIACASHATRINAIVIQAGTGGIQFDDSLNVGQNYLLQLGSFDTLPCCLFADGVSRTQQAFIRTKAGSTGRAKLTRWTYTAGCCIDARYTTFQNLGGLVSTNDVANFHSFPWADPSGGPNAGFVFRLNQCIVDGCSSFKSPALTSGASIIDFYQTWWTNSNYAYLSFANSGSTGTVTTGLRRCSQNVFDKSISLLPFVNGTVQNNIFFDGAAATDINVGAVGTGVDTNFVMTFSVSNNHIQSGTGLTDILNNYLLMCTPGCGIARFGVGQSGTAGTQTITGNIIECTAYNFEGIPEGLKPTPGAAVVTTNAKHNLFIRPAYDAQSQYGLSDPSSVNNLLVFDHNTVIGITPTSGSTGLGLSHVAGTNANARFSSFTNNILHSAATGAGAAYKVDFSAGNNTANAANALLNPANCHHNVGFGLGVGTSAKGYNFSGSGTPGTSDLDSTDSSFVGVRNFMTWSIGGLGNAVGTAFNSATPYVIGDIVSRAIAGFCNGATINYRCVVAHTPSTAGTGTYPGSQGGTWTISSTTAGAPMTLNLSTAVTAPFGGAGTLASGNSVVVCRTTDAQLSGRKTIGTAAASAVTIVGSLNSGLTSAGNQFVIKGWQGYWEPESEYELRRNAYQSSGYNVNATYTNLIAFVKGGYAPTNKVVQAASDNVSPSNGWIGALAGILAGGMPALRTHRRRVRGEM